MIELIKTIIRDFHLQPREHPVTMRDLKIPFNTNKVISILGPRRCGKTWLMYDLIEKLQEDVDRERIVYINFEDERYDFQTGDLQSILDAYQQLYPEVPLGSIYFFFDEIQEISKWEKFIRRLEESISKNIFITGSSAKLMSQEIATALRGRTVTYRLHPFSFNEVLRFHSLETSDIFASKSRNRLVRAFDNYLMTGGYPEILDKEDELRVRVLQSYSDIMIYRDIVERYNIRPAHVLKDMLKRLLGCNSQLFSVNKYYHDLKSRNIKVSKDKLYDFMDYFTDCYFISQVGKFSESSAIQSQSLKKIFINDPGVINAHVHRISRNSGWLLESVVFNELSRHHEEIFYLRNGAECDFIFTDSSGSWHAIQVCYELNEQNRIREMKGLLEALKVLSLNEGLILTHLQEETIHEQNRKIHIIPVWKWLLSS